MKRLFLMATCAISIHMYTQVQIDATNYGETTTPISAFGIGNFGGASDFAARLHINNFFCNSPSGGLNGLLFRTDGDRTVDNRWSIFSGTSASSQTERFRITTLGSSPYWDVDIDNIQSGSTGGETQLQLRIAQFKVVARGIRLGDFFLVAA